MPSNKPIKRAVLDRIAQGKGWSPSGLSTFSSSNRTVHVRYFSPPSCKFNINRNTLLAGYELWICGDEHQYYLIPIDLVRSMYDDPQAYPDRHHPKIRVVSVNVHTDRVMFAAGGKTLDLAFFRGSTLP